MAIVVRDGVVESCGAPPPDAEQIRLPRMAILPGLVSAHSHAFQRAIRARTEYRNHPVDDFWTWREAMYSAAIKLSPDDIESVSRLCFLEMARAGITCVGEFQYLHRDSDGQPYADANELDRRVLKAARDVGLRVVLLRAAYARSRFGARVGVAEYPGQKRFIERSPDEFLANLDALEKATKGDPLATVGAAPHSVRACPAGWIAEISAEARRRGWPLHMHLCEQPAEIVQCRAEHGTTPPLLLEKLRALRDTTTIVHAVHLEDEDVKAIANAKTTVCACPTTERNLGDGIVPADVLLTAGVRLCVGSDSQAQIDPLEDARAIEYHLRLKTLHRAVLDEDSGTVDGLGSRLYSMASENGMRSLGLPGGALRAGEPADFIVVNLDDLSLVGAGVDDLAAAAVFGLQRSAIREVWVAGQPVIRDATSSRVDEGAVVSTYRSAVSRLWGGTR